MHCRTYLYVCDANMRSKNYRVLPESPAADRNIKKLDVLWLFKHFMWCMVFYIQLIWISNINVTWIHTVHFHFHYENLLVQYTVIFFSAVKIEKIENFNKFFFFYFSYFCSKHRLWVHVRTASPRRF